MSVSNFDDARYARQNRLNPAEFAPGQGGANDIFSNVGGGNMDSPNDIFNTGGNGPDIFGNNAGGDIFGGSAGGNDIFGGGGGFGNQPNNVNDIFNPNAGMNGSLGGFNTFGQGVNQQQQMPQQKSSEDRFYEISGKAAKGSFNFLKDLVNSFKGVTPLFWQSYGYTVLKVSVASVVIGVAIGLLGVSVWYWFLIGGLLSASVGGVTLMFNTDDAADYTEMYTNQEPEEPQQPFNPTPEPSFDFNSAPVEDYSGGYDDYDDGGYIDEDDYDDYDEDDDWNADAYTPPAPAMSVDEAFSNMGEVPKGMYTRQYLYEAFTKVLPLMEPNYDTFREIYDDDDAFIEWGDYLRDAAEVTGCKEDYLPELLTMKKNLFTVVLTCDRPTGFKPELVAKELANIYAYKDGDSPNEGVYATVIVVGKECRITIFTGESKMVSLHDMYTKIEDYMLDSKNYMPVVFGMDQLGKVVKYDLKKLESIIITGMPRSGKSWFVQAILTQMCAFVPPTELNIIICDPKDGISDFKGFTLPHVKEFQTDDNKIINVLRHLVKVEAPRRKKIIGDAGFVNIWDYKDRYPDVQMPIIYVLVDEIVTLASRMDKETGQEFRMLLRELISQLPALGIRAFLIPHVLNNDIIEKKTSDLVPCKLSVCGDADHVEKATGAKFKDFPYKLVNKGDMAMKAPAISAKVMYVHGPALTKSNPENNDLFDYMRRVWSKLEPSEVEGSIAKDAAIQKDDNMVLNEFNTTGEFGVSADDLEFEDSKVDFVESGKHNDIWGMGSDDLDSLL